MRRQCLEDEHVDKCQAGSAYRVLERLVRTYEFQANISDSSDRTFEGLKFNLWLQEHFSWRFFSNMLACIFYFVSILILKSFLVCNLESSRCIYFFRQTQNVRSTEVPAWHAFNNLLSRVLQLNCVACVRRYPKFKDAFCSFLLTTVIKEITE